MVGKCGSGKTTSSKRILKDGKDKGMFDTNSLSFIASSTQEFLVKNLTHFKNNQFSDHNLVTFLDDLNLPVEEFNHSPSLFEFLR